MYSSVTMSVYLSRIAFAYLRFGSKKCFSTIKSFEPLAPKTSILFAKNDLFCRKPLKNSRNYATETIPMVPVENANMPRKKKIVHKKPVVEELTEKEGHYLTLAYVTANSYDLKGLKEALEQQKLYEPGT